MIYSIATNEIDAMMNSSTMTCIYFNASGLNPFFLIFEIKTFFMFLLYSFVFVVLEPVTDTCSIFSPGRIFDSTDLATLE